MKYVATLETSCLVPLHFLNNDDYRHLRKKTCEVYFVNQFPEVSPALASRLPAKFLPTVPRRSVSQGSVLTDRRWGALPPEGGEICEVNFARLLAKILKELRVSTNEKFMINP